VFPIVVPPKEGGADGNTPVMEVDSLAG